MDQDKPHSTPVGYIVQRVPIGLQSNSCITPDMNFRATQPSIGHFFTPKKSIAEDSYGVHRSEYGGTGETKRILGKYEEVVPRKTNHLLTALHWAPEPPMEPKIMEKRIKDNKSFFAGPIKEAACDIYELSQSIKSQPLPKMVQKQLFPRSIVYEIEYVKEQYRKAMMEALEKERKEFEELRRKQRNLKTGKDESENVGGTHQTKKEDSDETKPSEIPVKKEKIEMKTEEEPCASVCGLCGCILTHGECSTCARKVGPKYTQLAPKIKKKTDKELQDQQPRYGSSWGEQRQKEMMRVNYPFKTEAIRLYYSSVKPFDISRGKPKRKFLEKYLTSVNL